MTALMIRRITRAPRIRRTRKPVMASHLLQRAERAGGPPPRPEGAEAADPEDCYLTQMSSADCSPSIGSIFTPPRPEP
ncbi:hypothetical protein GCM10009530_05440 [Microbispora corallina]